MTVLASDERPHPAGPDGLWEESWQIDFARPDGVGGFLRLGLWPNQGVAWWWTYLLVPGRPLVAVRDHEVPLPRVGLELRTEGLWADLVCETPLEHWSVGLEAFGVGFDDPAEAWGEEWGERLAVGLDLEWELLGPPVEGSGPGPPGEAPGARGCPPRPPWARGCPPRPPGARGCPPISTGGYAQPGRVQGELLVGTERFDYEGTGVRAHRWGRADWWSGKGSPDDVHRYWLGLVGPDGEFTTATVPGDVAVMGVAPVLVTGPDGRRARLRRALCRAAEGAGWAEWLLGG